ncbi:MAG TPA: YqaJ viral recombinase family protein [Phycisphaerae bacterium]|nr:YqaJ viral recombinase family protein [Phycisphaerae bacterium]
MHLVRDGIGGSDIAAVLGVSKWKSAFDVWAKLLGQAPPEEPPNDAMTWGIILEPVVGHFYCRQHPGWFLDKPGHLRHKSIPYIVGTPDGLVYDSEDHQARGPHRGVEVKTAGLRAARFWGESGDEIPEEYLLQCQWYMILTGLQTWDVAALLGGQEYREYTLTADKELAEIMMTVAANFWARHVLGGVAPDPGGSEQTQQMIRRLYPKSIAEIRTATADECVVAEALRQAAILLDEGKEKHDALKSKLMVAMGQTEGLIGPFGRITWKSSKDSTAVDKDAVIAELGRELAIRIGDKDRADQIITEIHASHTTTKPGSRRFLPRWAT